MVVPQLVGWETDVSSPREGKGPMPPHSVQHVALEQVSATRRHVLDALMQLYLHDFSEHAPLGSTHGEMDEEGRFAYAYLDAYWQEAGRMPFLDHGNHSRQNLTHIRGSA